MVNSCKRRFNVQQLKQFDKHLRLKICTLIGMNDVRDTETRNKLVDKHAGYRDSLLILQCGRLNVFSKIIDDCQNVSVSTLHARKRANDVHVHAFKWRFRAYRSKCFAVARVSFVPIASRAFLTPVINVFTDLQTVKTLSECVNSRLNFKVSSRARAVCELDDRFTLPERPLLLAKILVLDGTPYSTSNAVH